MAVIAQKIVIGDLSANFSIRATLGNDVFRFSFYYNERLEMWCFSLFDQDESPIFEGVTLVLGVDYLRLVRDTRLPDGALFLVDETGANTECAYDDLGVRCNLVYAYDDGE